MNHTSNRFAWLLVGLVVGLVIGAGFARWPPLRAGMPFIGVPEIFSLAIPLFVTLWILLIAAAIKWLFLGRDRNSRLADLPADFDDWHRRAHAQMERETLARDGGTRP